MYLCLNYNYCISFKYKNNDSFLKEFVKFQQYKYYIIDILSNLILLFLFFEIIKLFLELSKPLHSYLDI